MRRSWRAVLIIGGALSLILMGLGFSLQPAQARAGAARLAMATHLLFKPFFWSVLTWTVLLLVALAPRKAISLSHGSFLIIPILYCVLLVLVYAITPWSVAEVVPLSLTRLLTHVAPLVVLSVIFQLKAAGLVPAPLCLESEA